MTGLERLLDDAAPAFDVPAGEAFSPWRLRRLSPPAFESLAGGRPHQLAWLAGFGLLAPTTHNTVPQRFALRPDGPGIDLWLDRTRVLRDSDPTGRQAVVSVGCVAANLVRAAESVGWGAHVANAAVGPEDVTPAPGPQPLLTRIARVSFDPGAAIPDPAWQEVMLRRKVVRAQFDERVRLDDEVRRELARAVQASSPELTLHLLEDAPTLLFLGKFQELADTTVLNRDGFARELGDWLLPNDHPSPRGMRGREFGLGDEVALHIHRGLRREERLLADEVAAFAKVASVGMRTASAVAVVTAARDDVACRLAAGRAYEDMALALERRGLRTAMHAAITEVEAPNLALRGRLRTLARPLVVFRIGRAVDAADDARPHSARPDLGALLLEASAA